MLYISQENLILGAALKTGSTVKIRFPLFSCNIEIF